MSHLKRMAARIMAIDTLDATIVIAASACIVVYLSRPYL